MLGLSVLQMNLTRNFREQKSPTFLDFPSTTATSQPSLNFTSDCRQKRHADNLCLQQQLAQKTRTEIFVPIFKKIFRKITKIVDTSNSVKLIYQFDLRKLITNPCNFWNSRRPQKINLETIFIVFLFKNEQRTTMMFENESVHHSVMVNSIDVTDSIEMTTEHGCRLFRGQTGITCRVPDQIKEKINHLGNMLDLAACRYPFSECVITNKIVLTEKNNNRFEPDLKAAKTKCLGKMKKSRKSVAKTTIPKPLPPKKMTEPKKCIVEDSSFPDTSSKSADSKRKKRRKKSTSSHHLPVSAMAATCRNPKIVTDELQQKKRKKKARKCQRKFDRDDKQEYRGMTEMPPTTPKFCVNEADILQTTTATATTFTPPTIESCDEDEPAAGIRDCDRQNVMLDDYDDDDQDQVDFSPSPKIHHVILNGTMSGNPFSSAFVCSVKTPPRLRQRQLSECSNDSIDICFMSDFEDGADGSSDESDDDNYKKTKTYRSKTYPSDTDSDSGLLDEKKVNNKTALNVCFGTYLNLFIF